MEKKIEKKNNSWYFLLAAIFGFLTAFVISGTISWALRGVLIGLLFAVFYVNVLVEKREV
jgi:hypothetical protein